MLEWHGGLHGIPHPDYVKAALLRPQSYMSYSKKCDMHLVAAIILESIARNHAFADGNKRTALIAMLMTYNLNSKYKLQYSLHMNKEFERLVLDVTNSKPEISAIRLKLKELIEKFSNS